MPDPVSRTWLLPIATAGGLGHLRPAPGTWGSLGGLALATAWWACSPASWLAVGLWALVLLTGSLGVLAAGEAITHFRRSDPSQVVIDEVAGQLTALAVLPAPLLVDSPFAAAILSFLAFRLFDIIKPWPIDALEHLPRGWGVMADDLAAGLMAGLLVTAVLS